MFNEDEKVQSVNWKKKIKINVFNGHIFLISVTIYGKQTKACFCALLEFGLIPRIVVKRLIDNSSQEINVNFIRKSRIKKISTT